MNETLREQLIAAGHKPALPTQQSAQNAVREFGSSETQPVIHWLHPTFGDLQLRIEGFHIGRTANPKNSPNHWAPIFVGDNTPGTLRIVVGHDIYEDIRIFRGIGPNLVEYTDQVIPPFDIKVEWEADGTPRTRLQDADNFNICFFQEKTGIIGIIQISLISRVDSSKKAHYFVGIQELYVGQTALISLEKAEALGNKAVISGNAAATMLPVHPENAHHMANPWSMFPECRPLVELALETGAGTPIDKCINPKWTPHTPKLPAELLSDWRNEGRWVAATTLWFNQVLGKGYVLGTDGRAVHVEHSAICSKDGKPLLDATGANPLLQPMQPVAMKYRQVGKGRQAVIVVPLF